MSRSALIPRHTAFDDLGSFAGVLERHGCLSVHAAASVASDDLRRAAAAQEAARADAGPATLGTSLRTPPA